MEPRHARLLPTQVFASLREKVRQLIRNLSRSLYLEDCPVIDLARCLNDQWALRQWNHTDRSAPPPPAMKHLTVKAYAQRFEIHLFIETGTYYGDMLHAVRDSFRKIVSIELDARLHQRAARRFARYKHISILRGDSAAVLPEVLRNISEPCLFWLDAHYSGGITACGPLETPISRELGEIYRHPVKRHVILIDDAREFVGDHDYPPIEELGGQTRERRPDLCFVVQHDIIRIHPAVDSAGVVLPPGPVS